MEKYIDDTDVYILDLGLQIYQYNGQGANKDERVRVSNNGHHWLQPSSLVPLSIFECTSCVKGDLLFLFSTFLKTKFCH